MNIPGVDEAAAAFWLQPVTRREVQKTFDEFDVTLRVIQAQQAAMNQTMSFLFAKLGVQKYEFETFMLAHMKQLEAARAAETPAQSPIVSL